MADWHLVFRVQPSMPPLAWVAAVRRGEVGIDHGSSVRVSESGLVEGTWAGPPGLAEVAQSRTVFGTGLVARGDELVAVAPSHHLECIYLVRRDEALLISNSLPGLLLASGLSLSPAADYSRVFLDAVRCVWLIDEPGPDGRPRLRRQQFTIPTVTVPITGFFVENLLIRPDLSTAVERKPREAPFTSFADYRSRFVAATASLFTNAGPYDPVVALSAGYDSAAVAAVAAAAGAKRSVGFATARPSAANASDADSGAPIAAALGLEYTGFDRLAYLERTDLADADLLASGMAGEDIASLAFEPELHRGILLNGYWGGTEFAFRERTGWRHVSPITTSGAGLTEYRLRADFLNVPLPVFGAIRTLDTPSLLDRAEMDPYRVGGRYDRPIPRRLAEEAGVKRGTFALTKRAANVLPPREGLNTFTPAAREAITRFSGAEGRVAEWRPRRPFSRIERAALRAAHRVHAAPFAVLLERRQAGLTHFEPRLGNLLLRWAVSVVSERYTAVERAY